MRAFDALREAIGRSAEKGGTIHISPGPGGLGGMRATETVAGLLAAQALVGEAIGDGAQPLVSSGDGVAQLALRGTVRRTYQQLGLGQDFDPASVRQVSQDDALAYSVGVSALLADQPVEASQMVGAFGQELMLATGPIGERGAAQLVGAASPVGAALAMLNEGALVGEEIYIADAYLSADPAPRARLLTLDALRAVVIGAILIVMLAAALGA